MQLLVARPVIERLEREMRRAGRKEIGGKLMGEHVRDELFRLVEISVQRGGGTDACFIRRPGDHKTQLEKFFADFKIERRGELAIAIGEFAGDQLVADQ